MPWNDERENNFFLALLENSTDLISIIDAEGRYSFVGGSVLNILGYQPQEMVGRSAFEYVHAEDIGFTTLALADAVTKASALLPPFRFRAKSGEWRWIEASITNKTDVDQIKGFVTNSRDVTDYVMEEKLKDRSQAHYESLFYNHPDAVFELNAEGVFVRVNKTVSQVLQYPDEEILGSHFQKFVHKDNMATATQAFINTMGGNSEYLELSVVRPSGEVGTLGITVFPVLIESQVVSLQGIAKDITLQKKYTLLVTEQAELLNNIMERIPQSFYSLDKDWSYTYVNSYYASYVGKSKEELIGSCIWELFPECMETQFYQECNKVAQSGLSVSFEETVGKRDDSVLSFQIYPLAKGVSVHFEDITERKRESDRLEKLALVASKTTTCVMVMDAACRMEWVNEAFEDLTGFTLADCFGREPQELLAGEETSAKTLKKLKKKLGNGQAFKGEVLNYAKDGRKIWFYLEITPIYNKAGQVEKFIAIRTDITERKQREQDLMRLAQDLFQQNRDLQQFSYMVSHNLRAPAANLIGLTDILQLVGKNSIMFDEALLRVRESAFKLDHVIRDMNQVLSVREGSMSLDLEEVDLRQLFDEVIAAMQHKLSKIRHTVELEVRNQAVLRTNKAYLFEVLKQLISNAIRFRKAQEPLHLKLSAVKTKKKVELTVTDNGIGMDMELAKDHIFKLYKKFHRGYKGRGAGLYLVKTYLDALHGSIKVVSEPGCGTTFSIKFKSNAKESIHH
ncbi:PAS domain-containing sensor histidine kinase [Pontibacter mangrovi]|uniref:histidine kinase n=1 Tax=Pontibacter mangrovi TaxID=2589816 RepID=A0A501WI73_9BACT|nr:PAS domain-containing sensor histidine kinase [Pontibacter mangrovi]TPE45306.1 PAS domain-containing sensor histidine kinase [Pontibacter mangrovi]